MLIVESVADHFSIKSKARGRLSEEKEAFPAGRVLGDGFIAASKLHVADLTFSKIFKNAIGPEPVGVAMLETLFASDDDD